MKSSAQILPNANTRENYYASGSKDDHVIG